jgi:hypothetical protein
MPKLSSRLAVLALTLAVVLVPAMARARQRVEHRDETRLSIKHSWLGVAPNSKATIAPQQIVVVPAIAAQPEPRHTPRPVLAPEPALHPVRDLSPDPLRGPPSTHRA